MDAYHEVDKQHNQAHEKESLVANTDESKEASHHPQSKNGMLSSHDQVSANAGSPTSTKSFSQILDDSWAFEGTSLLSSGLTLTAIVVTLHHFNGKKQPNWNAISLNTVVSSLSTVAEATALIPIGASLDQMKWIWFTKQRRPVSDLEFVRMVDPALKANAYDSLLNPDYSQPWAIPKFDCPSGNCSWSDVTSFHIQPRCVDLTDRLSTTCNSVNCTVSVKDGPSLSYAIALTEAAPSGWSTSMNISNVRNETVDGGTLPSIQYVRALDVPNIFNVKTFAINNKTSFVATSCSSAICAQLADISVRRTVFSEQVKQIYCNGTHPPRSDTYGISDNRTQHKLSPDWADSPGLDLTVGVWSYLAIYDFLSSLFNGWIAVSLIPPIVGLETPSGQFSKYASKDILQAVYEGDMSRCGNGTDHLECAATNVAKAMAKSLRDAAYVDYGTGKELGAGQSNGNVAMGDVYVAATYIRIHWWWLMRPVVVWTLGAVALAGTVWRSQTAGVPGWRANLLPLLLLYDHKGDGEHLPSDVKSNQAWEDWGNETLVQLSVRRNSAALD